MKKHHEFVLFKAKLKVHFTWSWKHVSFLNFIAEWLSMGAFLDYVIKQELQNICWGHINDKMVNNGKALWIWKMFIWEFPIWT